jgi:hypothetical protein
MLEDPRNITFCMQLMFCAKDIERIGDRATHIAAAVYYMIEGHELTYMIEGQELTDQRLKGDPTSFPLVLMQKKKERRRPGRAPTSRSLKTSSR